MSFLVLSVLESFLGECRKHNESSGQVAFDCCACSAEKGLVNGDGKGNLEVNYNLGIFRCWSCSDTNDMRGSVTKLIKKYGTPKTLRDYLLIKPDTDLLNKKSDLEVVVELPEGYKLLSETTDKDYKSSEAKKYLYRRGINDEIIKDFNIGYTYKGDFANRIIIPSYDYDLKLNYFIARWFSSQKTKLKYLNPSAEKENIIFNEYKLNLDSTIYLVEGVFDSIVVPNSIPLLGKYISDYFLDLLHDKSSANIVILFDDDALKDCISLYKQLNFGKLRDRIRICLPPKGFDPSLIYEGYGYRGIVNLLKTARKPTIDELN